MGLVGVVVVVDFDSEFVDFGCGGGMMFDFFFFYGFDGYGGGNGGCYGYGLVVRCLNFFFSSVFGGGGGGNGGCCGYGLVVQYLIFFLWVWWLRWWIGDYDGGLIFYFVCGFGCVWWWW